MFGPLREADKQEVLASCGMDANAVLKLGVKCSELCWIALVDDEPTVCFGARRVSALSDKGVPWLLATEGVYRVTKTFVKCSRGYVDLMASAMPVLENWIDARNTLSIRWLKWCGFTMAEKPEPFGYQKLPFFKFWLKGA